MLSRAVCAARTVLRFLARRSESSAHVASCSIRSARAHTCSAGGDEAVQGSALSTSGTVGGDLYSYDCLPPCTTNAGGDVCVNGGIVSGSGALENCACNCTNTGFEGGTCETASACVVGAANITGTVNCLNGGFAIGASPSCSCNCTNTGFEGDTCETASACVIGGDGIAGTIDCENGGVAAGTSPSCSCNCSATGLVGLTCTNTNHDVSTQPALYDKISTNGNRTVSNGDSVSLASGTYEAGLAHGTSVFYLDGLYGNLRCTTDDLTCVITGSGTRRVMAISGSSGGLLELRSLVLSNGFKSSGAGLFIEGSALVALVMCAIQDNEASSMAGGMYVQTSGTLVDLYGVSFSGNSASSGSDIWRGGGSITVHSVCSEGGDAAVQQSSLSTSNTGDGSLYSYSCGFHWVSAQPNLYNKISKSGTSKSSAGDTVTVASGTYEEGSYDSIDAIYYLYEFYGNVWCKNDFLSCILSGSGTRRVVLINGGGVIELRGIVVSNAHANGDGGGMHIGGSGTPTVTLTMCSIQDNFSPARGGGIFVYTSGTVVDLYGVSFSGNTSPDGPDINQHNGTITIHSACSAGEI